MPANKITGGSSRTLGRPVAQALPVVLSVGPIAHRLLPRPIYGCLSDNLRRGVYNEGNEATPYLLLPDNYSTKYIF